MPVDIGGYVLSEASGLKLGASNTKIAAANYGISDPMLPAMFGAITGGGTPKCYPYPVNDLSLNIGLCWSTSTFRFTAPVAGIYYTSCATIVGPSANGYYSVAVNGVNVCFSYRDTTTPWELHHIEVMVKLAAGDSLAWAMNIAPGPDTGGAGGGYRDGNHNAFTIWLVG